MKNEINKILQKHRGWLRGEESGEKANLRCANLHGADLHGADLRCANLHGADLSEADLRCANLHGADLHGADLHRANLSEADLSEADLHRAVGNLREIKSIFIDTWPITYTSDVMQIGCQRHPIDMWWKFTAEEISKMDSQALEWWDKYRAIIKQIVELSPALPTGAKV